MSLERALTPVKDRMSKKVASSSVSRGVISGGMGKGRSLRGVRSLKGAYRGLKVLLHLWHLLRLLIGLTIPQVPQLLFLVENPLLIEIEERHSNSESIPLLLFRSL